MSSCSHAHSEAALENTKPTPSKPLPEITINGTAIDETQLANELQYHQDENFDKVVQQAGQTLVIRQLLLDEAQKQALIIDDDNEEASIQQLIDNNVTYDDPSEETCLRYFKNNPSKFITLPLLEVDHILLAAAKDDIPGREAAKNQAKKIIEQLTLDPFVFSALAKDYSACPSKETGGSLGQISKGQTVPEFEQQLFRLPQGTAKNPIESRYGFHVVHLSKKIEGKPLEYPMVSDKIKSYLTQRSSRLAIQAYIQSLVEKADIEGVVIQFAEENIYI